MSNKEYIRKEFTSLVYTELRHCYSYFNLNTLTTHSYLLIESLEMIFLRFTYPCPSSLMFPTKSQRCRFGLSHSILPESLIKLSMSFMSDVSGNPCKKNQFVMTSKITFQYINPNLCIISLQHQKTSIPIWEQNWTATLCYHTAGHYSEKFTLVS